LEAVVAGAAIELVDPALLVAAMQTVVARARDNGREAVGDGEVVIARRAES
jgi:hypothetical protein